MIALAVPVLFFHAPAQQRTDQLRIRILNARTNQPIADERLNAALAADQIGTVALSGSANT